MSLTLDQRRAVEAGGDVCVTAGAGTGKTHMLSARYLQILRAHGLSPLEIVATTFTDMAAAEMRSRIRKDVAAAHPPFAPHVAVELEAAPIMTMHALAARICREHPDAAGVPADFTILADRPEGPLWAMERLDEALAALPPEILDAVPSDLLRSAMEAFEDDPLTAEEALARDPRDLREVLASEREANVARLMASEAWRDAVGSLRRCAGDGLRETQRLEALALADALARRTAGASWPDFGPVLGIKLNVGSKKGWDAEQYEAVKKALAELRDLLAQESLLWLEPGEKDGALAEMIPALRQAYAQVRAHLTSAKAQERVLDFGDLEVHALRALSDPAVMTYYRSRWRAFLLDEVQDTNPVQARLLARLTEGAILTIVGDEKQSIYGFRRADVTVFGRMAEAIAGRGGGRVSLGESFRTHGPLLELINRVCGPALGSLRQDLVGRRPAPHDRPPMEAAHVPKAAAGDVEARRRIEARHIARRLKAWHAEGLLVHDKGAGELRPMRWGDVAVLCRTGAPLAIYEEALAAEGIPTTLARGSDLLATREALDGTALLRFLADRRDDLALVAILRSPFFAVSDPVLHRAAEGRGARSWWQALEASNDPELVTARGVLQDLLDQRHELPSRLLQLADRLTGYSAVLAGMPGARRRLADWSGLIEQVRRLERGAQDVLTVVRRIRRLSEAEIELDRPALEAGDAVLLMTIHASKGLEWPLVVVPNLTADKPADRTWVRFDADLGVGLKFKDEEGSAQEPLRLKLLKRRVQEREEAEERRIYYVALTRARDRLLLTAPDPLKGALAFLAPGLEAAGLTLDEIQPRPGDERPPLPRPSEPVAFPARWFEQPLGTVLSELPVTALAVFARCPRAFAYRYVEGHPGSEEVGPHGAVPSDDAKELAPPLPVPLPFANRVGTAAHLALELDLDDAAALAPHVPDLAFDLVETALCFARSFRHEAVFREAREAVTERERPITLSLGGLELRGVVDAVGPDFVLDYKTDRVMDPDEHALQLWVYTQAVGKPRGLLAYLQHGLLHEFNPDRLEAAGAQAAAIAQAIRVGRFEALPSLRTCSVCPYVLICPSGLITSEGSLDSTNLGATIRG